MDNKWAARWKQWLGRPSRYTNRSPGTLHAEWTRPLTELLVAYWDSTHSCAQCAKCRQPEEGVCDSSLVDTLTSSRTMFPSLMNQCGFKSACAAGGCTMENGRQNTTVPSSNASKTFGVASGEIQSLLAVIRRPASFLIVIVLTQNFASKHTIHMQSSIRGHRKSR